MMHTWLNVACWECVACLVDGGCYVKATHCSTVVREHSDIQWKCFLCLVTVCSLLFMLTVCWCTWISGFQMMDQINSRWNMAFLIIKPAPISLLRTPKSELLMKLFILIYVRWKFVFSRLMASFAVILLQMQYDTHGTMPPCFFLWKCH